MSSLLDNMATPQGRHPMEDYKGVDSRAVANQILAMACKESARLDPMKLLKLTYISHGWVLGITGQPLIEQKVQAWPYGPVIPEVYHSFKQFDSSPIESPAMEWVGLDWKPFAAHLPAAHLDIVTRVWNLYKPMTGLQLSTLTHRPGTPWAKVTEGMKPSQIRNIEIPNWLIKDHYRELAMTRGKGHA